MTTKNTVDMVLATEFQLAYLARAVVCPATGGAQLPITITLHGRPCDTDRRVTVRREEESNDEPEPASEWVGTQEEWRAALLLALESEREIQRKAAAS